MVMSSDGEVLTGLRFINKQDQSKHTMDREEKDLSVFSDTKKWLDIYFSGRQPDFTPAYRIDCFTPFRKEVSDIMQSIPFGHTMTYGEIAALIAQKRGIRKMSAQAVGGAVGAGCWRCCRLESSLHNHSLPPCSRRGQKPYRLRRRHQKQDRTAEIGRNRVQGSVNFRGVKIRQIAKLVDFVKFFVVFLRVNRFKDFPDNV